MPQLPEFPGYPKPARRPLNIGKKWTNKDLPLVSKYGDPEDYEQPLDTEGFEELPTVDMRASSSKAPIPYTGKADRQPAGMDIPDNEESAFSIGSMWNAANEPLTKKFSEGAKKLSQWMDPEQSSAYTPRSIASAFVEGIGHALDGMTSPLSIGTMGAGAAGKQLAKAGTKAAMAALSEGAPITDEAVAAVNQIGKFRAANTLRNVERAASVPMVAQGIKVGLDPNASWEDKLQAVGGGIIGGLGLRGGPHVNHVAETMANPIQDVHVPKNWTGELRQRNLDFENGPIEPVESNPNMQRSFNFNEKPELPQVRMPNEFMQDQAFDPNATPATVGDSGVYPGNTNRQVPNGILDETGRPIADFQPTTFPRPPRLGDEATNPVDDAAARQSVKKSAFPIRLQESPVLKQQHPLYTDEQLAKVQADERARYAKPVPPHSAFAKSQPDIDTRGESEPSPFKQVDDTILSEMVENKNIDYSNPRLEDIPLDSIHGTQSTVNPHIVNDYIGKGDRPALTEVPSNARGRMDDQAPVVIRVGDQNILAGGHHRATADLANGKQSIQAVVYDANLPPDLLKRFKESIDADEARRFEKDQLSDDPSIIDDQGKIGWEPADDQMGYTGKPLTQEQFNQVRDKFWELRNQQNPEAQTEARRLQGILSDPRHEQFDTVSESDAPTRYAKPNAEEVMHGDTLEVATPDGETFWLDNITNPEEITAKIRSGELEVIQKTGSQGMKSAGAGFSENARRLGGDENLFPKEMRAKQWPENVAMGGAEPEVLDALGSSLYSKHPPIIAVKELLQNALDEHKATGTQDHIKVVFNFYDENPAAPGEQTKSLTVGDRGRGLTPAQIYTILTDVGKSGKGDVVDASGGFGFAKASPMLGGKYSVFESVVDEKGKKVRYSFQGDPAQLKEQEFGVKLNRTVMPDDTPTGFRATVHYDPADYDFNIAHGLAKSIGERSLGHKSPFEVTDLYNRPSRDKLDDHFYRGKALTTDSEVVHPGRDIEVQDTIKIPGAEIDVHYDTPDPDAKAQEYELHVLNNGMYQYETGDQYSQHGALKGVPSEIKVNVRATVKEGKPGYPFTLNREQLADHVNKAINKWIKDNLVSGALNKQIQSLRDMYNSMHPLSHPVTFANKLRNRPTVLFDPDNLLTDTQRKYMAGNKFIAQFSDHVDAITNEALKAIPGWGDRVEKVGISLDPTHHGIWIPNPDSGKAAILINPFNFIGRLDPLEAARENMSTIWHEAAHTQTYGDSFGDIDWSKVDNTDPEVAEFFKKYMGEVQHSTGVAKDAAHGLKWLRATAEVYAKAGTEAWSNGVVNLEGAFTDGKPGGGYSKDVQAALQIYNERKRLQGTKKNLLSGTGINDDATSFGEEGISSNAGDNGKGAVRPTDLSKVKGENITAEFNKPIKWSPKVQERIKAAAEIPVPKAVVKEIQQGGKVDAKLRATGEELKRIKEDPNITRDEKENMLEKALNFQRTVLTSMDISAPGRQGLPLISRKEWWTSWKPMFEALGSDKGYETVMQSIKNDPSGMFAEQGKKGKSFANDAGLSLTDSLDHREELFRSKFAEEFAGTKWFVKPSVRAYTAYLNKLRADTFKNLVAEAGAQNNLPVAREIAKFVNVATGRGSLGAFEPAAKPLAQIFFSPRLTASRLQMYTRTLNPFGYAEMPPVIRREQMRSMLALAGAGLMIGQLAKGIGATVNLEDSTNSDFGKIRFGDTRIDPFGGHQQFLVSAARLLQGKTTSSMGKPGQPAKQTSLTSGKFGMPTRASVFGNFMKNKLAPVPSFIWSWMEGKNYDGMPFSAKDEAVNKITPIVMQDLYEIWKEDPTLLQGLFSSASAFAGGGVQTYGR